MGIDGSQFVGWDRVPGHGSRVAITTTSWSPSRWTGACRDLPKAPVAALDIGLPLTSPRFVADQLSIGTENVPVFRHGKCPGFAAAPQRERSDRSAARTS